MSKVATASTRIVIVLLLLFAYYSLLSCDRPSPLTAEEIARETLGTPVSLQALTGKHSIMVLGFVFPNMHDEVSINEKDWYDGSTYWDTSINAMTIRTKVSLMFKTGLVTTNSISVSLSATESELKGLDTHNKPIPGTLRGLKLGDPKSQMLKLYGQPSEQQSDELATDYLYKAKDYTLSLNVENNSERILGISTIYLAEDGARPIGDK